MVACNDNVTSTVFKCSQGNIHIISFLNKITTCIEKIISVNLYPEMYNDRENLEDLQTKIMRKNFSAALDLK
jgi:hypothetical protein